MPYLSEIPSTQDKIFFAFSCASISFLSPLCALTFTGTGSWLDWQLLA